MLRMQTRADNRARDRLSRAELSGMAAIVTVVVAWRRNSARRKAIADLTPDQLMDIGHPEASRPTLDIKAGLITNLMSMR